MKMDLMQTNCSTLSFDTEEIHTYSHDRYNGILHLSLKGRGDFIVLMDDDEFLFFKDELNQIEQRESRGRLTDAVNRVGDQLGDLRSTIARKNMDTHFHLF